MRAGSERTAQSTHSLVVDAGAVAGGGAHERCGREGVERREEGEHLVANFLHPFDREHELLTRRPTNWTRPRIGPGFAP
jgi:hypothetical protein